MLITNSSFNEIMSYSFFGLNVIATYGLLVLGSALISSVGKSDHKKLQFKYEGGHAYLDKKEALENGLNVFNKELKK